MLQQKRMSVQVERTPGQLTDHYDPRQRVLRLSEPVHDSYSLAALGVAAHETGHAIQHEEGYFPLGFRNSLVPIANFGSTLAFPLLLIGLLMGSMGLARIGVYAFTAVVLFQLITLPVEFNASNRAIRLLADGGYITQEEIQPTRRCWNAAALTYVAAALMAFLNLARLLVLTYFLEEMNKVNGEKRGRVAAGSLNRPRGFAGLIRRGSRRAYANLVLDQLLREASLAN